MAHKFEIRKNKAGEFVAYFTYNGESIFWTEGYSSKASARNAIESIKKNGPAAEVEDTTLTADA
ncbi:YegP family protein [Asticcacaulis solisilvae]|uniref:YegP family protein n=1 Tax=Asticcacaulis solisilvae TaxID=1217274 RepID=UPI003FD75151